MHDEEGNHLNYYCLTAWIKNKNKKNILGCIGKLNEIGAMLLAKKIFYYCICIVLFDVLPGLAPVKLECKINTSFPYYPGFS